MEYTYVLLFAMFGVTHNSMDMPESLLLGIHNCFKWFDEDRNRKLDMREFFNIWLGQNPRTNSTLEVLSKRLTKCDTNMEQVVSKLFTSLNTNRDLIIDMVEVKKSLGRFDGNGDKRVTREEFIRYIKIYVLP